MGYQKTLVSGDLGSVSVSESEGVVSLTATASVQVGGGEVAGAVGLQSSTTLNLNTKHLIDVGLGLAAAKFPGLSAEIELLQSAVDAELAKL